MLKTGIKEYNYAKNKYKNELNLPSYVLSEYLQNQLTIKNRISIQLIIFTNDFIIINIFFYLLIILWHLILLKKHHIFFKILLLLLIFYYLNRNKIGKLIHNSLKIIGYKKLL